MVSIVYKVDKLKGIEGKYKNKLVANRHLRKLKKKYKKTQFKIKEGGLI